MTPKTHPVVADPPSSSSPAEPQDPYTVHLLVICHGLWGTKDHLKYIVDSIEKADKKRTKKTKRNVKTNEGQDADDDRLVVLTPISNEWTQTYDGVDYCAERVTREIHAKISELAESNGTVTKFSIVGYSLGGLIARYTLGLLHSETPSFFDKVKPVNFTTFASPAVGVSSYPTFPSKLFHFLGSRLLSRTGPQLYGLDKFVRTDQLPSYKPIPIADLGQGNASTDLDIDTERDTDKDITGRHFTPNRPTPSNPGLKVTSSHPNPISAPSQPSALSPKLPSHLPLLLLLSHPSASFNRALSLFPKISIYANAVQDMTVPYVSGAFPPGGEDVFADAFRKAKERRDRAWEAWETELEGRRRVNCRGKKAADAEREKEKLKLPDREEWEGRWGVGDLREGGLEVTVASTNLPLIKSIRHVPPIPIQPPPELGLSPYDDTEIPTSPSASSSNSSTSSFQRVRHPKEIKPKSAIRLPRISRVKLPGMMRPSFYPFRWPLNYVMVLALPITLPGFFGYAIARFLLQSHSSRSRIRKLRVGDLATTEQRLHRVGIRIGISNADGDVEVMESVDLVQAMGEEPQGQAQVMVMGLEEGEARELVTDEETAAEAEAQAELIAEGGGGVEAVDMEVEVEEATGSIRIRRRGSGAVDGSGEGSRDENWEVIPVEYATEATSASFIEARMPDHAHGKGSLRSRLASKLKSKHGNSTGSLPLDVHGKSNQHLSVPLTRLSSSAASSSSALSASSQPPQSSGSSISSRPPKDLPLLSSFQHEMIYNLNTTLPQLRKYLAYFPDQRNCHGSIICRDESWPGHRSGKGVVDHWSGGFRW